MPVKRQCTINLVTFKTKVASLKEKKKYSPQIGINGSLIGDRLGKFIMTKLNMRNNTLWLCSIGLRVALNSGNILWQIRRDSELDFAWKLESLSCLIQSSWLQDTRTMCTSFKGECSLYLEWQTLKMMSVNTSLRTQWLSQSAQFNPFDLSKSCA